MALDHGHTLQHGGPNLRSLRYLTIPELQFFQTSAPRAELRKGGVIQLDMDKLQDPETILGEVVASNNEAHVLRRWVPHVMLPGELDCLRAVPDGVGNPGASVAVHSLVAPAEAERVQQPQRSPPKQQVLEELGEFQRPVMVVDGVAAGARLADVEAARGGPQVAPPSGEHGRAHRLPCLEVPHDPEEDPVGENAEAVAAASGRPQRCCVLRGHFVERVTCTDAAAGMNS